MDDDTPNMRELRRLDALRPAPGEEKTQHQLDVEVFDAFLWSLHDGTESDDMRAACARLLPRGNS